MVASAPRRAKRVDGGAPSVEGLGHGRLAQLAERWPHMLRPEIGPLGKSLTCRGVFLSAFGWRGIVWGEFEPVAGITAGITERSSSAAGTPVQDVGVDHRGADVTVTEQFLHRLDIVVVLQQVRGERMAKGVASQGISTWRT